jgi:hypothetical protein
VLACSAPALAATTISGTQTTPVQTKTANNGSPDDVTITGTVNASPAAVTVNSNNVLTNSGTISIKDVDNSTGVLILGPVTGNFTNNGAVTVTETYTPTDSNGDGVVDGNYASGTGRYGLRLTSGTLTANSGATGAVVLSSGGTITVQGNASYGVSLEAPVVGDFLQGNVINVTGGNTSWVNPEASTPPPDQVFGISEKGGITGKVQITGTVTATGGGAVGADFSGDISKSLSLYSALTSTGFRVTTRSSDPAVNAKITGTPSDVLQSGSALRIRANVLGGVFIGAPPAGTVITDTTTDKDKDGIVDSLQGTGTITTFGQAPAMLIGTAGRDVHLGQFSTTTSFNEYGLIVEGTVVGNGVFDNNSGTGMQIGAAGGTVHIDGGVRIVGAVTAQGYEANSTGIHVLGGATAHTIDVEGAVSALNTTSQSNTPATAILLDPNASVTSLVNYGAITGSVTGDNASAAAVVDKSGSITSVTNTGVIGAGIAPTNLGDKINGEKIALDLRVNTTGVTITQNPYTTPPNAVAPSTLPTPAITGNVYLGQGVNTVNLNAGNMLGNLSFGGGGAFNITNGATYRGALTTNVGAVMNINVASGVLEDDSPTLIKSSGLNVGPTSQLIVSADPVGNTATEFAVTGNATIASGGQLGLHVLSLPNAPQSFTVISATHLTTSVTDTDLTGQTPYLFVAGFHADPVAGTVVVNIRRRTAEEAGLNRAEGEALDPVYNNLPADEGIQRAFLAQTTQPGLVSTLDQMLPDYAGGTFRALQWASEQQGVATADRPLGEGQAGPTRAWTQEIVLHEQKDRADATGYNILAFGLIGGLESVSSRGDALGVKLGFTTADVRDPSLPSDNLEGVSEVNAGVYWRGNLGGIHADAQLGAGYVWIHNRREFLFTDNAGVVHNVANGYWNGYTLSGRLGLTYTAEFGNFFIEPSVHADYFRSHESGYSEQGGGPGFDLAIGSRTGDSLSVTGTVTAGATFGEGFRWRPQIEVGYRDVLSGSAGVTTAQFAGDPSFALTPESIREGALIGRAGIRIYSDYLDLLLDGGVEHTKDYTDIDVHLTARTLF